MKGTEGAQHENNCDRFEERHCSVTETMRTEGEQTDNAASVKPGKTGTYLCCTVVTVSVATLFAMFFAATSRLVHMAANPVQGTKYGHSDLS